MLKNTKTNKGFTIIEVLIVLAIAGLIMLIVFLAVPALQRNSRNTSRRSDVSRVLGAVQEVSANSNGAVTTAAITVDKVKDAAGTLGYYTSIASVNAAPTTATGAANTDTIAIYLGSTCDDGLATKTGATSRQVAVIFAVEPGTTKQCVNS